MSDLLNSLLSTANTMRAMDRQLAVIQNNVANASTPGYVKQVQTVQAKAFSPELGGSGGVEAGAIISARSEYAEEVVRRQASLLGASEQKAGDLSQVDGLFDVTGKSGISGSLSQFFEAFSNLSVNPNDTVARQNVIDQAGRVAASFQETAGGLATAGNNANRAIRSTVDQINQLAAQIAKYNGALQSDYRSAGDPGLDADIHASLEELSSYGDISVLPEPRGGFSVYLGSQIPLIVGDKTFAISADNSGSVFDSTGAEVGSRIHSGKLAAAIDEAHNLIPSYTSDLNQLAEIFASTVNNQLGAGLDRNGAPPAVDLFQYDPTLGAATSIVVTGITPDQIAAASAGAPGGNGNALILASMAQSRQLNGFSFSGFYGNLAGRIGQDTASAKAGQEAQTSLLAQSRNLREQASSVNLDEEAALLLQVQRQYQAVGKLMGVLNDLTDTLLNIVR